MMFRASQSHVTGVKTTCHIVMLALNKQGTPVSVRVQHVQPISMAMHSLGRTSRKSSPFFLCCAYHCARIATHMRTLYFQRFSPLLDIIWRQSDQANASVIFNPLQLATCSKQFMPECATNRIYCTFWYYFTDSTEIFLHFRIVKTFFNKLSL